MIYLTLALFALMLGSGYLYGKLEGANQLKLQGVLVIPLALTVFFAALAISALAPQSYMTLRVVAFIVSLPVCFVIFTIASIKGYESAKGRE